MNALPAIGNLAAHPGSPGQTTPAYPGMRGTFTRDDTLSTIGQVFASRNGSVIEELQYRSDTHEFSLRIDLKKGVPPTDLWNITNLLLHNDIMTIRVPSPRGAVRFILHTPVQIKKMFELVLANNDFPADYAHRLLKEMNETKERRIPSWWTGPRT